MTEIPSSLQIQIENTVTHGMGYRLPEDLQRFKSGYSLQPSGEFDDLTLQACLFSLDFSRAIVNKEPAEILIASITDFKEYMGFARRGSKGQYLADPHQVSQCLLDYAIRLADVYEGIKAIKRISSIR